MGTTSPITNNVSTYRPALEGVIGGRYSYAHNAKPFVKQRTFAMLDISFENERCTFRAEMHRVGSEPSDARREPWQPSDASPAIARRPPPSKRSDSPVL